MNRFISTLIDQIGIGVMRRRFRDRKVRLDPVALAEQLKQPPADHRALFGGAVEPVDLSAAVRGRTRATRTGMSWTRIEFESPRACGHPQNDLVRVHWVSAGDTHFDCDCGRPLVVIVHGYRQQNFGPFFLPLMRTLHGIGWDTALIELPHHFSRRAPDRCPGEELMHPDPAQSIRGVAQAVLDVRTLLVSARAAGAAQVALLGVSLGGLVAALVGTVHRELRHLVLAAPIVDPADAVWHCLLLRDQRDAGLSAGLRLDDLRRLLAPISPVLLAPAMRPADVLLLQPQFDLIARRSTLDAFAARWGITHRRRLPLGHFLFAAYPRRYTPQIARFLQTAAQERKPLTPFVVAGMVGKANRRPRWDQHR